MEQHEEQPEQAAEPADLSLHFDYAFHDDEHPELFENHAKLADYGTHWFPIHKIDAVVFPQQQQPLKLQADEQEIFDRIVENGRANGFVVLVPSGVQECETPPFIATVCRIAMASSQSMFIGLVGFQRCKVLEFNAERTEVNVQLLPEVELPELLPKHLPIYAKNLPEFEKNALATRVTGYPFDAVRNITKTNTNKCASELRVRIGDDAVEKALAKGLTYFSYFAAQKIYSNRQVEYNLLKENSADARIAKAAEYCGATRAFCDTCNYPVFHTEDVLKVDDPTMSHVNEHGYVHKITLVSQISSICRRSMPSTEFSWFPGYAWTILLCRGCRSHIGWEFTSETLTPNQFFGVRRDGLRFRQDNQEEIAERRVAAEAPAETSAQEPQQRLAEAEELRGVVAPRGARRNVFAAALGDDDEDDLEFDSDEYNENDYLDESDEDDDH